MVSSKGSLRISVRVEPISDITGKSKLSAITDGYDTLNRMAGGEDVTGHLRRFEARYNEFLQSATPLAKRARELSKTNSNNQEELLVRWRLSNAITQFLAGIRNDYDFSNYRKSISRDLELQNEERELDALLALRQAYKSSELIDPRLDWALILSAHRALFPFRPTEAKFKDSDSFVLDILSIAKSQARLAMTGARFGAGTVARQLIETLRRYDLI